MQKLIWTVSFIIGSSALGCKSTAPKSEEAASLQQTSPPAAAAAEAPPAEAPSLKEPSQAEIGKPAPDFELSDLDGNRVRLSAQKGKIVVLEWFNPGCPFVRASYTKGSLVGTAARHTKQGALWYSINSGAPGKQGHGIETNRDAKRDFKMNHPILLDETGDVGRRYGAKTTPHLFVIDKTGVLAYAGAIDNSPDGERESPKGGTLVNYVDEAVAALLSDRKVEASETEPYGCSVKYAK